MTTTTIRVEAAPGTDGVFTGWSGLDVRATLAPMSSLRLLLPPLLLALTFACGKKQAEDKAKEAKFEPGPTVEKRLTKLGNLKISVPDNLMLSESEGSATLEAEGFPTVTITHTKGEQNGTGTRTKSSSDAVSVSTTIPTAEWECKADKPGDHEDLIVEICKSMSPTPNPNVSAMTCKTVTGFDADPVGEAWSATAETFTKCFGGLDKAGLSFGFNLKVEEGSRSFTKYTSPMIKDEKASTCVKEVYAELEKDPSFTKEGLEAGQIECDGAYSRF